MIPIEGADILVVGMAKSGLAAVELLRAHGARVRATDQKRLEDMPEVAARLRELEIPFAVQSPEVFQGCTGIVVSPGVPADLAELEAARAHGVSVVGELELAAAYLEGDVIGITGANGKTTTTALIGHILSNCGIPVQVGGNIGRPPAAMVADSRPGRWNVLELSSFQLETIEKFRARVGVVINVTPDHLDRHHTFSGYAAAKERLFENQVAGDIAVLNADDATCMEFARRARSRTLLFSLQRRVDPGAYLEDGKLYAERQFLMDAGEIPLRGLHNVENTLAAVLAARQTGAALESIAAAVRTFPGVEHRIEFVRTVSGVSFYNDSKATNVDATQKAIDAFDGRLWLILGGKDKGSDYRTLRASLEAKAHAVLLVGAASVKIAGHLDGALPLQDCGTIAEAVRAAYAQATPGDIVLLAPACASFDQFSGYEERGRVFKNLVSQLEEKF
jgi:UDP-N-acetylmuramoylalanine--D-glutamate ligase